MGRQKLDDVDTILSNDAGDYTTLEYELAEALKKYGTHTPACKKFSWRIQEVDPNNPIPCTCGLAELVPERA